MECGALDVLPAVTAVPSHVESIVIAGLDPAIYPFRKKMDARIKSAHDGREQRSNSSGIRYSSPYSSMLKKLLFGCIAFAVLSFMILNRPAWKLNDFDQPF